MSKNNAFDLFDVSVDNIKDNTVSLDQDLYKPSPENGRNGTYSSIVRFVPWHGDTHNPIIKKWTVFVEDPITSKKRTVDCPSTVNEKSVLRELFFKFYNSNSAIDKELANKFKRKRACYALVYVIEDKNRPELEGKIMVFRFGAILLEKILNEMQPKGIGRPRKPFDPFLGRPFSLVVSKRGGYANYDSCEFLDESWPLVINGKTIDRETTEPSEILEWLKANSPDLSKYEYKKWDEQTVEFVNEAIRNTVPNGRVIESTLNSSTSKSTSMDSFEDDFNDSNVKPSSNSSKVSKSTSVKIEEDISNDDSISFDDDDDDFYSGLEDDE